MNNIRLFLSIIDIQIDDIYLSKTEFHVSDIIKFNMRIQLNSRINQS